MAGRVNVILAGLIYDTDVALALPSRRRPQAVYLVQFQRGWIARIVNAGRAGQLFVQGVCDGNLRDCVGRGAT